MAGDMQNKLLLVTGDRFRIGHPSIPFVVRRYAARPIRKIVKFQDEYLHRRQSRIPWKRKQRPTPNSKT